MNEIERKVVLPSGARPLSAYGRNYAFSGRTMVLGVYLIPSPPFDPNAGCVHGDMKPCSPQELQAMARRDDIRRASQAAAGTHRWFEEESKLPGISDGGCMQITVRYDIPTKRVLSVGCNGLA